MQAEHIQLADLITIGQGSQKNLNNNILLATAGAGATDASEYKTIIVQINVASGTVTAGAVAFEGSNDNTNFTPIFLEDLTVLGSVPVSSYNPAASTNRFFGGAILFQYVRIR